MGILCALEAELGAAGAQEWERQHWLGLELRMGTLGGAAVISCAAGVGKVAAAHGAAALLAQGARALLVVGTCGALDRGLPVGTLVHCERACQVDLAHRAGRESQPDAQLAALWRELVPGPGVSFLTADRPVLNPLRRMRLRRAYPEACVAEMETAAAAAVAVRAGVPWAALRVVTDGAGFGAGASFRQNLAALGGLAADTAGSLIQHWSGSAAS
ncbi:MAG: adenosylhomocysteine nucleosidase [Planctomycetota bacterium]